MLRIILVRHCETDLAIEKRYQGNKDVPLNSIGRKNAKFITEKIKGHIANYNYEISKIYSSCLSRSYETAEIIKARINFKGEVEKICELNERNFGDWEGMTYNEISSKYGKSKTDKYLNNPLNFSIQNAETFKDFKDRALKGLNFILNVNKEEIKDIKERTIIVVAHGGTNRIIICDALNLSFENFFMIKQDFGGINVIEYYPNEDTHKIFGVIDMINGNI